MAIKPIGWVPIHKNVGTVVMPENRGHRVLVYTDQQGRVVMRHLPPDGSDANLETHDAWETDDDQA